AEHSAATWRSPRMSTYCAVLKDGFAGSSRCAYQSPTCASGIGTPDASTVTEVGEGASTASVASLTAAGILPCITRCQRPPVVQLRPFGERRKVCRGAELGPLPGEHHEPYRVEPEIHEVVVAQDLTLRQLKHSREIRPEAIQRKGTEHDGAAA